jgi:hypothetical protein
MMMMRRMMRRRIMMIMIIIATKRDRGKTGMFIYIKRKNALRVAYQTIIQSIVTEGIILIS